MYSLLHCYPMIFRRFFKSISTRVVYSVKLLQFAENNITFLISHVLRRLNKNYEIKTYLDFLFFLLLYSADIKKFRSHSQVYCCSVSAVVAAAPSQLFLASVKRLPLCVYRTTRGGGKGFLFPLSKRKPPPVLMPLERFFSSV